MKKVAGRLKLVYSQYRELASFAQFGSDLDQDTKTRLAQGERIVEVLKQNRSTPIPVEKQVAIIYSVINDILAEIAVTDIAEFEKGLFKFLDTDPKGAAAMEAIRTTGALSDETEANLRAALEDYKGIFLKTK
jgi:F-type H+-transporting ATPase subunit alpha